MQPRKTVPKPMSSRKEIPEDRQLLPGKRLVSMRGVVMTPSEDKWLRNNR